MSTLAFTNDLYFCVACQAAMEGESRPTKLFCYLVSIFKLSRTVLSRGTLVTFFYMWYFFFAVVVHFDKGVSNA